MSDKDNDSEMRLFAVNVHQREPLGWGYSTGKIVSRLAVLDARSEDEAKGRGISELTEDGMELAGVMVVEVTKEMIEEVYPGNHE